MQKIININKNILGGTPVFQGTRVPIKNLLDYIEGGETIDDFLKGFPSVTKKQVLELLEKAGKVITSEKFIHEDIN
ncbi:MAG: DUF433 domain-containing protein [Bacteroidota bacterium]|nr:DUF433 domain-containing protein [Bacteroidota bacterium]